MFTLPSISMLLFGSISGASPQQLKKMDLTCDQTLKSCAKDLLSCTRRQLVSFIETPMESMLIETHFLSLALSLERSLNLWPFGCERHETCGMRATIFAPPLLANDAVMVVMPPLVPVTPAVQLLLLFLPLLLLVPRQLLLLGCVASTAGTSPSSSSPLPTHAVATVPF